MWIIQKRASFPLQKLSPSELFKNAQWWLKLLKSLVDWNNATLITFDIAHSLRLFLASFIVSSAVLPPALRESNFVSMGTLTLVYFSLAKYRSTIFSRAPYSSRIPGSYVLHILFYLKRDSFTHTHTYVSITRFTLFFTKYIECTHFTILSRLVDFENIYANIIYTEYD